ncbi:MAG: tRNA uridine-5-carboxymethylaminomethyl(34) synthesis GTPase MnmE [Salinivirgaceae bacterium]|nr:tRNA uridine-5-carboxymethylaminomethyl(34) synthesis GTPase MnmE [Salinivirgaceae bacterium]
MDFSDTICAISTAAGNGAIAIVRLSGPQATAIAKKVFSARRHNFDIDSQPSHTAVLGTISNNGAPIDEVLLTVFRAPHSYTGDDIVEIGCHGSTYIQQQILQTLIANGARMAAPGEFTQRAFLNGKMDLSQAEAVADLIASTSAASHRVALNQMRGGISTELAHLRDELLKTISLVELELDFSEEDVEFADRSQLRALLYNIGVEIDRLIKSFSLGNAIKNGVPVAIIGEPNVGKSTLLNAILKEDRAIVSDIAGTTRDAIEDTINIDGVTYRFIDTAGIRQTTDTIENLGIEKTFEKISRAAIVIAMFDAADSAAKITASLGEIEARMADDASLIVVLNKCDIHSANQPAISSPKLLGQVSISAKNGNIDSLIALLTSKMRQQSTDDVIITNARHYNALLLAREALDRASDKLRNNTETDLLAIDIHDVIDNLGSILGSEITPDEVLGNIFSHFCIGK